MIIPVYERMRNPSAPPKAKPLNLPKIRVLVDKEFVDTMKRIQDEAAQAMTGQLDALYRKAISLHLGTEDWNLEEVTKRIQLHAQIGVDLKTVTLDGNPILVYGEPAFEGDKFTRKYHIIQPSCEK